MAKKQFVLVSYDITNDKKRLKAMKAVEDYGSRVQYSVFECLLTPKEVETLKARLKPYVDEKEIDSVRFYFLCLDDVQRIEIIGHGKVTADRAYYYQ